MRGGVTIGNEEQRDKRREKWLSSPYMVKWYRDGDIIIKKSKELIDYNEKEVDDVYIYQTIRYPPKSTPPNLC